MGVLNLAMIPFRSHLSIATDGLVLILPVVVGVVVGGSVAGVVTVVVGSLDYVFVFIPPYYTPLFGGPQNLAPPGVYLIVMLLVSRVVASMDGARLQAYRQKEEVDKLFELSRLLVGDKPLGDLLDLIVSTLRDAFDLNSVAVLLEVAREDRLEVAACAGAALSEDDLRLFGAVGTAQAPRTIAGILAHARFLSIALATDGDSIGRLVLVGESLEDHDREPFLAFANQTALALERARLREEAVRAKLLEEVDRLAKTLVAAVSHDLRTPLASIKMSASTLCDPDLVLTADRTVELAHLIDDQADRLARLVANLLDMTRVQAGVLELRRELVPVADLITDATHALCPTVDSRRVRVQVADDVPLAEVDRLLTVQVIFNLIENAARHSPPSTAILVAARLRLDGRIEITVEDEGPGVPTSERTSVFAMFNRRSFDAGAGLGLAIAKAFVMAHGQEIWAADAIAGGAKFCFTLSPPVMLQDCVVPEALGAEAATGARAPSAASLKNAGAHEASAVRSTDVTHSRH
jgi:two-component system sensor histidine kinase KdpD